METNTERNFRVQKLYDELMAEGKHGHYEIMFHIVRLEVEAEREACANVCHSIAFDMRIHPLAIRGALDCKKAITARSNAELCGGPSGPSERAPGYASAPKTEE